MQGFEILASTFGIHSDGIGLLEFSGGQMFPDGFSKYVMNLRIQGLKPAQKLARYSTRYKVAGQLQSIQILGVSSRNAEIYTLVFRIGLGYSALESLESEIGKNSVFLKSQELSATVKSPRLETFRNFCLEESNQKLSRRLKAFFDSDNNLDLRPVVEVLRNTMFHGQFSPNASGLRSLGHVEILKELEFLLFKSMNERSKSIFRESAKNDK